MTTLHKFAIAFATMAFAMVLTTSLLLQNRRVEVTLQKSVALTSSARVQGAAGLRVHFVRDANGYQLTKEGWITKSFDGQQLGGTAAVVVDSRR